MPWFNPLPDTEDMSIWAKIGWSASGLLVLAALAVMFLLHWLMGVVFALFTFLVLWWVFGVLKKKTDHRIREAAGKLDLHCKGHPFRYASMQGSYKGLPVRISYESNRSFGLGSALVSSGGAPGLAALDIRNITLLSLEHGLGSMQKQTISQNPFPITVRKEKLLAVLPGISTDARQLAQALEALAIARESLVILSRDPR